jgi:hypothetical protein
MSHYTNTLKLTKVSNNHWVVAEAFEFHYTKDGTTNVVVVPSGEKTDLASVPKQLQWLIPKSGDHDQAAVVHDKICRDVLYDRIQPFYKTHRQRSAIFLDALKTSKVSFAKRWAMYLVVLFAGSKATTGSKFYG